jgi:hypothetical protein
MMIMPAVVSEVNRFVSADDIGLFTSIYQSSGHLGNFSIPGYMTLLAMAGLTDVRSPVLASSVGLFLLAAITLAVKLHRGRNQN